MHFILYLLFPGVHLKRTCIIRIYECNGHNNFKRVKIAIFITVSFLTNYFRPTLRLMIQVLCIFISTIQSNYFRYKIMQYPRNKMFPQK